MVPAIESVQQCCDTCHKFSVYCMLLSVVTTPSTSTRTTRLLAMSPSPPKVQAHENGNRRQAIVTRLDIQRRSPKQFQESGGFRGSSLNNEKTLKHGRSSSNVGVRKVGVCIMLHGNDAGGTISDRGHQSRGRRDRR